MVDCRSVDIRDSASAIEARLARIAWILAKDVEHVTEVEADRCDLNLRVAYRQLALGPAQLPQHAIGGKHTTQSDRAIRSSSDRAAPNR